MKNLDDQIQSDIEQLINIARPKLALADKGAGSKLFNEIIDEFGPIAHRVYLALDKSEIKKEYHDAKKVLLDPWTVINRAEDLKNSGITINDCDFWLHGDMIKTLCDYIDLRKTEVINAST